jgi:hypothetical protein
LGVNGEVSDKLGLGSIIGEVSGRLCGELRLMDGLRIEPWPSRSDVDPDPDADIDPDIELSVLLESGVFASPRLDATLFGLSIPSSPPSMYRMHFFFRLDNHPTNNPNHHQNTNHIPKQTTLILEKLQITPSKQACIHLKNCQIYRAKAEK